ncbi:MAG: DUF1573 domain-containing protein [Actinomycetota bacterium]
MGLTIGAFAVAFGAWIAVRIANPAPPKAVFTTTENAIGHVVAGETADVSFPVRNAGGKDLRILGVQGSCGCLNPKFPSVVKAGKTGVIQTTFTPSPEWRGQVKKELSVQTNDPLQREIKLHVEAEVDPLVAFDPPSPLQLQVHRGETAHQIVRITPREGIELVPGQPEVSAPYLKAKLAPAGDGKSHLLTLAMGPCNESLDLVGKVTLRTTSTKMPTTSVIAVALQLDGPVASPAQILFSSMESGEAGGEITRLQVFSRGGEDFNVRSVRVTIPGLTAEVTEDTPGRLYGVKLVRKGPLRSGRVTGKVEVHTDHPKYPLLSVPVDLTVR